MYTYDGMAKNKSNKIGAVKLGGTAFFHSSQIMPKGPDHKKKLQKIEISPKENVI